MEVLIGHWNEPEARELDNSPSYYAADWETLRTRPGRYPVFMTVEGGYNIPMPYWVLVAIDADRVAGKLYSGFGGVNFGSEDLPKEPTQYRIQSKACWLAKTVEGGHIELLPEWSGLAGDYLEFARSNLKWGEGLLAKAA